MVGVARVYKRYLAKISSILVQEMVSIALSGREKKAFECQPSQVEEVWDARDGLAVRAMGSSRYLLCKEP